ncbi:suppressor of fused domain protein [Bacillaceae bacterium C204]|uniref:suppressor of fused domain protein n=1 Tax=Neobacillus sp. 204 TaxID=3383351 RepID=UPI00397D9774
MDKFIQFLEDYLGTIECGWTNDDRGERLPVQIAKYSKGPYSGTKTFSTLGLNKVSLTSYVSGKQIWQELIFVSYSNIGNLNIPALLAQVSQMALDSRKAFLRGDVIGPNGPIFDDSNLEALYVTIPGYFPDSFDAFKVDDKKTIIMAWLIPITSKEAEFIRQNGWEEFEDKLEELDPDLIDIKRESII